MKIILCHGRFRETRSQQYRHNKHRFFHARFVLLSYCKFDVIREAKAKILHHKFWYWKYIRGAP